VLVGHAARCGQRFQQGASAPPETMLRSQPGHHAAIICGRDRLLAALSRCKNKLTTRVVRRSCTLCPWASPARELEGVARPRVCGAARAQGVLIPRVCGRAQAELEAALARARAAEAPPAPPALGPRARRGENKENAGGGSRPASPAPGARKPRAAGGGALPGRGEAGDAKARARSRARCPCRAACFCKTRGGRGMLQSAGAHCRAAHLRQRCRGTVAFLFCLLPWHCRAAPASHGRGSMDVSVDHAPLVAGFGDPPGRAQGGLDAARAEASALRCQLEGFRARERELTSQARPPPGARGPWRCAAPWPRAGRRATAQGRMLCLHQRD